MVLHQSNLSTYLEDLAKSDRKALFLFFPNFEERSVASAGLICEHVSIGGISEAMVFWLQRPQATEILDEIKAANRDRVLAVCKSIWPRVVGRELRYPGPDPRAFQTAVRETLSRMQPKADIVVDISATPRDMLFQLFEFLFPPEEKWPFRIGDTEVQSINFIYSWAQDYPIPSGPELLGDLTGYYSGKPLLEVISGRTVTLAVCGAGTGHDAMQAVAIADRAIPEADLECEVFFLLQQQNPIQSFTQMMRHQALVRYLRSRGRMFRSVFTIEHFSIELMRIAREAAAAHSRGGGAFVVGPFGPKPLGLCAYFAVREYRRQGSSNTVDILDLSGAQYLSHYSLGVARTDLYRVSVDRDG